MAKFSLCIEPVFPELDFYDRIAAAAELGCDAIEFWDPAGRDPARIGKLAAQHGVSVAICCVNNAWANRTNGPVSQLLPNLVESAHIVKDMGCHSLIALSGDVDAQGAGQKQVLIDNLKRLAETAERENVTLCVEALNSYVDHKGYYLDSARTGFEIMKAVGSPRVKLLYDVYHMQIMEGNLIQTITENIADIGHFHSAGVPGRHELFSGEIQYPPVIKAIDAAGYQGFFGMEYWPTYDHRKSVKDVLAYIK
jgi:hydroxypyruvate isomerase